MISTQRITDKLGQLDEYLDLLAQAGNAPRDSFLADKILIGGAKYYLQVSIECCLDIANHIISAERFRAPRDYADTFKVLEEKDIIEKELSTKLRQMAKFRNRLVHLYGEIEDTYVYQFINEDLADIQDFKKVVIDRFLS